jgi:hypothetical protein
MFSCAAEAGYRTIDVFTLICKKEEKEKGKCETVMESDPAMKAYYEILLVKALSSDVASAKMSKEFEEWRVEKEKEEEKIEREVKKTGVAEAAPMPGMLSSTSLPLRQVERLTLK